MRNIFNVKAEPLNIRGGHTNIAAAISFNYTCQMRYLVSIKEVTKRRTDGYITPYIISTLSPCTRIPWSERVISKKIQKVIKGVMGILLSLNLGCK